MKKLLNFLRSMQFGLILLGLIVIVSFAGSLIPQGEHAMDYVTKFPNTYSVILALQLDHVFTSWYFILLAVALCINLIFCTIVRVGKIQSFDVQLANAEKAKADIVLNDEQKAEADRELRKMRCKVREFEGGKIYYRNGFGRYGSFMLHLGILLTLIFWALAMYMPKVTDQSVMPGGYAEMEDGTKIRVSDFNIVDATGRLDYRSVVNIQTQDGRESGEKECSVNYSVKFGKWKVYQQTYGTIGKVRVSDQKGNYDEFILESNDMLSADGKNGILYDNLYPGYTTDEDGQTRLETSTSGRYENPVYVYTQIEDGKQTDVMLAFPGDKADIGDYTFEFLEPVEYPGLRIKESPVFVNWLLILSMAILTLGIYIVFFAQPVIVVVNEEGMKLIGAKTEGIRYALRNVMKGNK